MKKNIHTTIVALAGGAATVASALAAGGPDTSPGFYASGGIGPAFTDDTPVEDFFGPVSGVEVKYETGFRFTASGGYRFNGWLSAEAEFGVIHNAAERVTGTTDADFRIHQVPFLVNVILQLPRFAPVYPFVGAGAGFSASVLDAESFTLGGTTVTGSDSDIVFAYQLFAGVRYELNEQMSVGLAYKFFSAEGPDWETDIGPIGGISFGRSETHSLLAMFTYRF